MMAFPNLLIISMITEATLEELFYDNNSFMEDLGGTWFDSLSNAVRKRSQTSRRPRPDSQPVSEGHDLYPLSSTPHSDDTGKGSSDENGVYDINSKRKEFNLNQCVSPVSLVTAAENEKSLKKSKKDGGFHAFYNNEPGTGGLHNIHCSKGVLAPANWKGFSKLKDGFESESRSADVYGGRNSEGLGLGQSGVPQDGFRNDNSVKKVKLKVGGVTRTIQANSSSDGAPGNGSMAKSPRSSDVSRLLEKQRGNSDDNPSSSDKKSGLQGVPWKDFSRGGFGLVKEDSSMGKMPGKSTSAKQGDKTEPVRKSKRVPKRCVLVGEFGDDEGDYDDEIRYLEKLKTLKVSAVYREDEEFGEKHQKLSSVSNMESSVLSRSGKDGKKKSVPDKMFEDTDYDEEESGSDGELVDKKKKQKKESVNVLMDGRRDMTLTTRQRALQSSKDASASGASLIEFPNGLPPAPPRKQKEKLTEVEQQLKKAEAAQRRRMQVEKAARESEAEAIRKILGQDSNRKRRKEKMKKRQEELAQEKAANARMLASNTIRYVMGPSGTVVTFPEEMGLPSIFNSKPFSYPPPREKCAGPSCTNPYKYRDSKSKLPLCSLKCYKAVREKMAAEAETAS